MLATMEANPEAVSVLANNLVLIQTKMVSMTLLLEKVRALTAPNCAKFVSAGEAMQQREIVMSEVGRTLGAV